MKKNRMNILVTMTLIASIYLIGCVSDDKVLGTIPPVTDYPTTGLVAYFPFNSSYQDVVSTFTNEMAVGELSYTQDKDGNTGSAIEFLGNRQYLDVELVSYLMDHPNYEASIAFWMKPHPDVTIFQTCIAEKTSSAFGFQTSINVDLQSLLASANFNYAVEGNDDVTGISHTLSSIINPNEWIHIALTIGNNEAHFYLNGVLTKTKVLGEYNDVQVEPVFNPYNHFIIGANYSENIYWLGALDELFFYQRLLNPNEVKSLFER